MMRLELSGEGFSMKYLILVLLFTLIGCNDMEPYNYKCSQSQHEEVLREFELCNKTQNTSVYCYNMARSVYCEDIRESKSVE